MRIDCILGLFRKDLMLPREPFSLDRNGVRLGMEDYFAEASNDGNRPQIDLRINYNANGRSWSVMPPSVGTSLPSLQTALSVLVGNPSKPSTIPRVGFVIADELPGHPYMMGLMFDTDFDPDSNEPSKRLAREGFAVFLHPIYRMRAGQGEKIGDEFAYVLMHEMGHIFNLWHTPTRDNFLAVSDAHTTYDWHSYRFSDEHKRLLSQCETNAWVRPCGVRWIGDNPWGSAALTVSGAANEPRSKAPASLNIDVSQKEFWPFEPVQLDVTVALRKGLKRPVSIPDCIDPGYEAFRIFVETPDGERLRYRACAHYCLNSGSLEITADRPFRRDISLFGQSGGYTFCRPGLHRVFATLRLPDGQSVESNTVEVNVRPPCTNDSDFSRLNPVLTRPKLAKFLFHRAGKLTPGQEKQLASLSTRVKDQPVAADIQYTLGRAGLKEARGHGKSAKARRDRAREYLKRAADHKALGEYRRAKARRMLEGEEV